ncbi:MAG: sulfatase-like hydrolase/transferase [Nocardioidaceae bacterium]
MSTHYDGDTFAARVAERRAQESIPRHRRRPTRRLTATAVAGIAAAFTMLVGTIVGTTPTHTHPGWPSGAGESYGRATHGDVVVILTDDMRYDDLRAMPFTRRFFEASWRNHYSTTPLCCPARATLLTGQYAHNHHVTSNVPPTGGYSQFKAHGQDRALPTWFDEYYHTAFIGKYLNGYGPGSTSLTERPRGWDSWQPLWGGVYSTRAGSYTINANGKVARPQAYQTHELTRRAVRHIAGMRHMPQRRELTFVSYMAPHHNLDPKLPYILAAPRYRGDSNAGVPESGAFNERRIGDKPAWLQRMPRLTAGEVRRAALWREQRRDALRSVDDGVRAIVEATKRAGSFDRTMFVFTSDNGFQLGEHRVMGKRLPYRESARVPLLMHGPQVKPGVRTQVAGNIDVARTLAIAANVEPRLTLDGVNLLRPYERRMLLLESPAAFGPMPEWESVVGPALQYTEWSGGDTELYDIAADPGQTLNRSGVSRYGADAARAASVLDQYRDCAGAGCR